MNEIEKSQGITRRKRIYFLDNLRTFMIFLVVVLHTGLVYEKSAFSSFYWIVYDPSTNELVGVLRVVMDLFIMSTIFFIAGYLTPMSLKTKTPYTFLKSKFKRLIIPWIIAVLTLIPLYKYLFLLSRDLPQQNWTTYFHWSNDVWGQNWLWFLPVLFLFDLLYLLFSRIKTQLPDLSLKKAAGTVFLAGLLFSIYMDVFQHQGWTKTLLLDFQNERLLIYFLIFLLGVQCYKLALFDAKPRADKYYLTILFTVWVPTAFYYYFYTNALIPQGGYFISPMADILIRWFSFHLAMLCLLYLLIQTFRIYLDKQNKIGEVLNSYSYPVYIIHVVVMGGLALVLLNSAMPSLLKFLVLAVSTFFVSNLLIHAYRKTLQPLTRIPSSEKTIVKPLFAAILIIPLIIVSGCGQPENLRPSVDLHTAAATGNLEAIQQHIAAGSDLNAKEPTRLSSPLITAAVFGQTEAAQALIDAGAAVNYQNNEGSTALITAALLCRTEIVQALLDNGADKTLSNKNGRTAMDVVARPFEDVKPIYDGLGAALAPVGLVLDYEHLQATRPKIAEMLR